MTNQIPASLAYILIYNATLPPPAHASRDDEDAQEEAHILFYTSRERAVSRDRMLRQVGLAKALVNFSDTFSLGHGCDNVHSQTKRMSHVSPEPDFWMHACVDLAHTQKQNRDDAKVPKGKDPPQVYHYHEDSVHDLVIRSHLLRGYEAFKLLHGTFTSIIENRGPEGLRVQLERFFTPWAWKWDLERPVEFSTHLGLPLHPSNSTLAPIAVSFFKNVPSNATPLLVSPPYIIDPKQTSPRYPPSLPVHLLSLIPPQSRPVPRRVPSKPQNSLKDVRTVATDSTSGTLGFLSATSAGMGSAVNVKKWSWPEALTFGKYKPPQHSQDRAESETLVRANHLVKMEVSPSSSNAPATHAAGDVDQAALDDAISSQNSVQPPDGLRRNIDGNDKEPGGVSQNIADASSAVENQRFGDIVSPSDMASSPPPPNGHSFSVFKAFISEPSDPLVIRRRSVLYLSMFQLVFALLMDADWVEDGFDQSLEVFQRDASVFLQDVRRAIDFCDAPSSSVKNVSPVRVRHVICSPHSNVSFSEGFSTTSSQFFEGQELLARDTDTIEVFSRTATSQRWFVARRGLGFNKAGDRAEGEAYLETSNKDASLVDADNELVRAVRRWVHPDP